MKSIVMNFANKNIANAVKAIIASAFPIYFLIICYFYRPAGDDFGFYVMAREGVLKNALLIYLHLEGPFLLILVSLLSFLLTPFAYYTLSLILIYFSFFFFFSTLWNKYKVPTSTIDTLLLSSLILTPFYFCSPSIPSIWHLMNSYAAYNTAMIVPVLFAVSFLLREKPLYAMPFLIFLMQSRINLSIIVACFYLAYCANDFYRSKKINKTQLIIGILMLIALLFYVFSPGNNAYKRILVAQTAIVEYENLNIINCFVYVSSQLLYKTIPYLIIFLLPSLLLIKNEFINKIHLSGFKILFPAFAVLALVIYNSTIMYVGTTKYFYAPRVWNYVFFAFILVFLYYLLQTKLFLYKFPFMQRAFPIAAAICVSANLYLISKTLYVNYPIVQKYAVAYDSTINYLRRTKVASNQIIIVPALPDSGLLFSWGVTPADDYTPYRISQYLRLKSEIHTPPLRSQSKNDTVGLQKHR